jgi:hypothetical protein
LARVVKIGLGMASLYGSPRLLGIVKFKSIRFFHKFVRFKCLSVTIRR